MYNVNSHYYFENSEIPEVPTLDQLDNCESTVEVPILKQL